MEGHTAPARERQVAYDKFFKTLMDNVIMGDNSESQHSLKSAFEEVRDKDLYNKMHETALDIQYLHMQSKEKREPQHSDENKVLFEAMEEKGFTPETIRAYVKSCMIIRDAAESRQSVFTKYIRYVPQENNDIPLI